MRAIVFDLDGTLVDSAPDIQAAVNRMLEDERLDPLTLPVVTSFIGNGLPKLVERVMEARNIDRAEFGRIHESVSAYYSAASSDLTVPYPHVEAVLKDLKTLGFCLGVCTNKPFEPARDVLAGVGLADYFDVVIGGDSLEVKKPDPAPLQAAFSALSCDGGFYVGDSEIDGETAQNAGIAFALFTEGYRKAEISAIPHAYAFSDFRQLLGFAETALTEALA